MCHMNTGEVSATKSAGVVGVVGAGAMGSGIAQVAAQAGHEVYLVDAIAGAARAARERLAGTLAGLAAKGKLSAADADAAAARIHAVDAVADLPACEIVVEAIRELFADKVDLFTALAATQPANTIFATNTSSLDITEIAEQVAHPERERVAGMHFFNPAAIMKLVEVVAARQSDPKVLDRITALARAWGKTPVRCTSTPGFIVNRVARPYYGEGQRIVEGGYANAATVDWALKHLAGFRMGPMELTDLIGHDVNYAVGESVWKQTGKDPRYEPTLIQRTLVDNGDLGRKTGKGFFTYDADGKPTDAVVDEDLARRLVGGPIETDPVNRTLAMLVNEAVDLVARGEASAEDVDIAMQLGTNYPKGPIQWGHEIGFERVHTWLRTLDAAYPGGRYRPSPALLDGTVR
ncbi:MAG: 3-hydroxyacyl-CoA dehydrogenase [Austwickia sp.]|nr:3-hydroxyacyl-CoA dehydrogenase [Austwickia sp.]MBK8437537.1 3-hydroxyacyl-CoA dehydrogenase [Austwickia sp.]MBK9102803.1 3-hydroxyacyl-CoA dehydrogenase [Austwickia sp.]